MQIYLKKEKKKKQNSLIQSIIFILNIWHRLHAEKLCCPQYTCGRSYARKKVITVSTVITGNVKNISNFDAKFPSHCVKFCLGQAEQCKARQG